VLSARVQLDPSATNRARLRAFLALPSGEPHGIRIAEITTRIVQVIEVTRSLLADFLAMEHSQVGVYVLVGKAPATTTGVSTSAGPAICGPAQPTSQVVSAESGLGSLRAVPGVVMRSARPLLEIYATSRLWIKIV
jgi:hypothetical protein